MGLGGGMRAVVVVVAIGVSAWWMFSPSAPRAGQTYTPPRGTVTVGAKTQTFKGGACFKRRTGYKYDVSIGGSSRLLQIQLTTRRAGRYHLQVNAPSARAKVVWRSRRWAFAIDSGSLTVAKGLLRGSFRGVVRGQNGIVGRGRGSWRCFNLVAG